MPRDATRLTRYCQILVDRGKAFGVELRAIGGIGVRLGCPAAIWPATGLRPFRADLDLVARLEQLHLVDQFLESVGFQRTDHHMYARGAHNSYRFTADQSELGLDVYFGQLRFNHPIPGPYVGGNDYAVAFGALLLLKLAIAYPSKKDIIDLCALLHQATSMPAQQSAAYLSRACGAGSDGWGLHRTCLKNLERVTPAKLKQLGYDDGVSGVILEGRNWAIASVNSGWRSIGWRLADVRNRLGCRSKWFSEVEPA